MGERPGRLVGPVLRSRIDSLGKVLIRKCRVSSQWYDDGVRYAPGKSSSSSTTTARRIFVGSRGNAPIRQSTDTIVPATGRLTANHRLEFRTYRVPPALPHHGGGVRPRANRFAESLLDAIDEPRLRPDHARTHSSRFRVDARPVEYATVTFFEAYCKSIGHVSSVTHMCDTCSLFPHAS